MGGGTGCFRRVVWRSLAKRVREEEKLPSRQSKWKQQSPDKKKKPALRTGIWNPRKSF